MDDRPGMNELRIEAGDKENAAGAVARISDRIIDCPVKVIVIGASRGRCAEPIGLQHHSVALSFSIAVMVVPGLPNSVMSRSGRQSKIYTTYFDHFLKTLLRIFPTARSFWFCPLNGPLNVQVLRPSPESLANLRTSHYYWKFFQTSETIVGNPLRALGSQPHPRKLLDHFQDRDLAL